MTLAASNDCILEAGCHSTMRYSTVLHCTLLYYSKSWESRGWKRMKLSLHLTIIALLCSWCCSYIHCVCVCWCSPTDWTMKMNDICHTCVRTIATRSCTAIVHWVWTVFHRTPISEVKSRRPSADAPTRSINRPSRPTIILRITFLWSKEPTFN